MKILLLVVVILVIKFAGIISEVYRHHKLMRQIRKEVNPK